jgi:hypothetical protein
MAAAVLLTAIAAGPGACGGDESDADEKVTTATRTVVDPKTDRSLTLRERAAKLAEGFGNRGSKAERDRLLAVLGRAQRAFRAGDGRAVCATMGSEAVESYGSVGQCARKASSIAAAAKSRDLDLPVPEIVWVRVYGDVGGVTMLNPDGDSYRLAFAKRDGTWEAHFFLDGRPEALNVRLRK